MIESIKCSNFQSLRDLDLELGKFTVIVGASSSGKSALTRAIKSIASNDLGTDKITQGTRHSAISVKTDLGTVTIERDLGGSSAYKITKVGSEESRFARLNRQVPTEVTEVLGIAPSTKELESINFAGQHDAPYLLKESSSNVARILGELTNVSTIFSAVREANKRAKNASSLLNLRKKDLDGVITQISEYAKIGEQAKQVSSLEELYADCATLQAQADLLEDLLDRAVMASQALSRIKEIPDLPDTTELLNSQQTLNAFKATLREVASAKKIISDQRASFTQAQSAILQAEDELHQTLVAAGQCPLCNQEVTND